MCCSCWTNFLTYIHMFSKMFCCSLVVYEQYSSNMLWLFCSLKPSWLVWFSLHSFSLYSHCLKLPLRGLLNPLFKPFSFVILIQTFRCLLLKFNSPVKFIWFRYTHNMRRRERESWETLWRGALATFVGKLDLGKKLLEKYCQAAVCQVVSHIVAL